MEDALPLRPSTGSHTTSFCRCHRPTQTQGERTYEPHLSKRGEPKSHRKSSPSSGSCGRCWKTKCHRQEDRCENCTSTVLGTLGTGAVVRAPTVPQLLPWWTMWPDSVGKLSDVSPRCKVREASGEDFCLYLEISHLNRF